MRPAIAVAIVLVLIALVASAAVWYFQPSDAPRQPSPSTEPSPTFDARTGLPNVTLTPGALNPNVTQAQIRSTICKKNWTRSIRPPVSFTNQLKTKQLSQYGYADLEPAHYEEDHLIPLELGGAPRSAQNLWPEPRSAVLVDGTIVGAKEKDDLEVALNKKVCAGDMKLAEAQQLISTDWIAAWNSVGRP